MKIKDLSGGEEIWSTDQIIFDTEKTRKKRGHIMGRRNDEYQEIRMRHNRHLETRLEPEDASSHCPARFSTTLARSSPAICRLNLRNSSILSSGTSTFFTW